MDYKISYKNKEGTGAWRGISIMGSRNKERHMSPLPMDTPIGTHPPQQSLLPSIMKSDPDLPEAEVRGSRSQRPAYETPFYLFLAVCPRTNYLSLLSLGFFVCKTGIIIIVPTL